MLPKNELSQHPQITVLGRLEKAAAVHISPRPHVASRNTNRTQTFHNEIFGPPISGYFAE